MIKTIYIASSWRNQHAVEMLTDKLESMGFIVWSFIRQAEETEGRGNIGDGNIEDWIASSAAQDKFVWDLSSATGCDLVIYLGPSGQDAWAEIGAAWASGRTILGLWAKGEKIGLMRHMVSRWFNDYKELLGHIGQMGAIA